MIDYSSDSGNQQRLENILHTFGEKSCEEEEEQSALVANQVHFNGLNFNLDEDRTKPQAAYEEATSLNKNLKQQSKILENKLCKA